MRMVPSMSRIDGRFSWKFVLNRTVYLVHRGKRTDCPFFLLRPRALSWLTPIRTPSNLILLESMTRYVCSKSHLPEFNVSQEQRRNDAGVAIVFDKRVLEGETQNWDYFLFFVLGSGYTIVLGRKSLPFLSVSTENKSFGTLKLYLVPTVQSSKPPKYVPYRYRTYRVPNLKQPSSSDFPCRIIRRRVSWCFRWGWPFDLPSRRIFHNWNRRSQWWRKKSLHLLRIHDLFCSLLSSTMEIFGKKNMSPKKVISMSQS